MQHGGDDAYLLLVSGGEVAYEFLLSHDFTVHETLERSDASVYFFFFKSVHLADEVEVFLRRKIVYQETVVYESAGKVFPVFAFAYVYIIDGDLAAVGLQQIQYQPEKGGLPGSVVSYQAQHITLIDEVVVDIYGGLFAELLLQITYLNHSHKS